MKITRLFGSLGVAVLFAVSAPSLFAPPPAWWAQRSVLGSGTVNDYAAVNLGQVKRIATLARDEFQAKLSGGAGTAINTLVDSWAQPPGVGVVRNDYAAVSLGQLKALAKLYYDRLAQVGYSGQPLTLGQTYPWTTATSDDNDYAAANIGQVKYLFSFDLTTGLLVDTDGDGMPDSWETTFGTNPNVADANLDPDSDGLTNLQEYRLGRHPLKPAITDDGTAVKLRIYAPVR